MEHIFDKIRKNSKTNPELENAYAELKLMFNSMNVSSENAENCIQLMHDRFGLVSPMISQQRTFEQWYYRVRPFSVFDYQQPAQFGHPPHSLVGLQRCNFQGKAMFYASELPQVALDETGVKIGDRAFLSLWRSGNDYPTYGMIPLNEPANTIRFKTYSKYQSKQFSDFLGQLPLDLRPYMVKIRELEKRIFRGPSDNYPLSALFCYRLLTQSNVDGIEYPDAKTGTCYNFALTPEYANKLKIHRVYEIERKSEATWQYFRFGTLNSNNKLEWREPVSEDDPYKLSNDPVVRSATSDITSDQWAPP